MSRRKSRHRRHTVKVLEVGQLDPLAHAEHIGGCAHAVDHHPDVASVQSRDLHRSVAAALDGVLDVGPSGNDRTEDHQTKGEQGHASDRAAKPEDLTVRDEDDGQVLEDGIHGDRKELEGLGAGVDHADQQKSNGEPYIRGRSPGKIRHAL